MFHLYFVYFLLTFVFSFFLSSFFFICTIFTGRAKDNRRVEFAKSKNGEQILLIDQHRYFRDKENAMLVFWKCHEYYKSKCEAQVATMKKDRTRVVVLNDTHIHLQLRRVPANRR